MIGAQSRHVIFDIVGTCISYDVYHEALETRLGERFRAHGIGAKLFAYAWSEAAEKEYICAALSGHYLPVFEVFRAIFYRTLWQAGIKEPRTFASDEDREFVLAAYRNLKPRPGLAECFDRLRKAGFTVWALTSGDTSRVAAYLANGGIDFPAENFFSCDNIGMGKPAPATYQYILNKLSELEKASDTHDAPWFAAAHMWDVSAARRSGFKAAWVSVWEKEPCPEIFGAMEVMAHDLPSLADGIIAASSKQ